MILTHLLLLMITILARNDLTAAAFSCLQIKLEGICLASALPEKLLQKEL